MAHDHLDACPSLSSGLPQDCSCAQEEKRYTDLAKLSLGLFAFEIIGGLLSGSMALMSDALHVLVDGTESVVNAVISFLSRHSDNEADLRAFGGKISALLLLLASTWIIYEGLERFHSPHPVEWYMVVIAVIGLGVNLFQRYILWKAPREHRNIQHFWQNMHLWGDIASSLAVIVGGVIMWTTNGFYWIDGLLSIGIGIWLVALTGGRLIGINLHQHQHGSCCGHDH